MRKYPLFLLYLFYLLTPSTLSANSSLSAETVLLAGGDILFTPNLKPFIKKKGYDYPFLAIGNYLKSADIIFANLEVPLTDRGTPMPDKGYTYRARPIWAKVLASNGFNLLALANNHLLDYGNEGLTDTINLLRKEGIKFCGAGENIRQARQAARLEVNGIKIACLAYSLTFPEEFYATENRPGTAFAYEEFLKEDIPAARASADILIVSFHWGGELRQIPKPYQRKLARKVVDLGADIVLGHHPHILQGIEVYRGKLIAYSLGNLAFSTYSKRVKKSMLIRCRLGKNHTVKQVEIIPLSVDNFKVHFQPKPLSGKAARDLLCYLEEISTPLGGEIMLEGNVGMVLLDAL